MCSRRRRRCAPSSYRRRRVTRANTACLIWQVRAVLFDKTGTLTKGSLEVSTLASWETGRSADEVLRLAASAEKSSEHPIAAAIVSAAEVGSVPLTLTLAGCRSQSHLPWQVGRLQLSVTSDFAASSGLGIACAIDGERVVVGNRPFLVQHGLALSEAQEAQAERREAVGDTVVLLGSLTTRSAVGMVALSDTLKHDAAAVVRTLHGRDIQVWMVSGDNVRTATHVARQLAIPPQHVCAGVLPDGKAALVSQLQARGLEYHRLAPRNKRGQEGGTAPLK